MASGEEVWGFPGRANPRVAVTGSPLDCVENKHTNTSVIFYRTHRHEIEYTMRRPKHLDPAALHARLRYDPITGQISLKRPNRRCKTGYVFTTNRPGEYIHVTYDGKPVQASRVAWVLMTGEQPDIVDHINGIKHDNRWLNLRSVTFSENLRNGKSARIKAGTYVPLE